MRGKVGLTGMEMQLADSFAPAPGGAAGELRLLTFAEIETPAFSAAWERLALRAAEPNPFFEPWFLVPSLRHFDAAGPVRVAAWFRGEQLAGLMPILRSTAYYGHSVPNLRGWLHPNAFAGVPLVAAGHEEAFWEGLIAHCDADAKGALFAHFPLLAADGPVHAALQRVLARGARPHYVTGEETRALLSSDMSAADYLAAAMSAKKRKELRRQHNRLAEAGALTFERLEGDVALAEWTAEFLALEAAGWKGEEGSALASAPETAALFEETLAGAAAAGRLERLALRLDGRAIAMLANFLAAPGAFSFKTAFDESLARFSPGVLLQLENLALLERPGIDWADSCAAEGHPMIERLWRGGRRMVSLNIAIGGWPRRALFRLLMAYETRSRS
jgi:CelD/BcsL family acetyltransferase involved in cellulose biosynthesis